MQFLLLIYIDDQLVSQLTPAAFDEHMHHCLKHADQLKRDGSLISFQQLEAPSSAKTVRSRGGRIKVVDGPFTETKEMLAGFNLIEAESLEAAVTMAGAFPWTKYGSVEVRPLRDVDAVRRRVGVPAP